MCVVYSNFHITSEKGKEKSYVSTEISTSSPLGNLLFLKNGMAKLLTVFATAA